MRFNINSDITKAETLPATFYKDPDIFEKIKITEIMTKKLLVTFLTIFVFANSYSQKNLWTSVSKERLSSLEKVKRDSNPTEFLLYSLDFQALKLQLQQAPLEGVSNVIVQFPGADGKMTSFKMFQIFIKKLNVN